MSYLKLNSFSNETLVRRRRYFRLLGVLFLIIALLLLIKTTVDWQQDYFYVELLLTFLFVGLALKVTVEGYKTYQEIKRRDFLR